MFSVVIGYGWDGCPQSFHILPRDPEPLVGWPNRLVAQVATLEDAETFKDVFEAERKEWVLSPFFPPLPHEWYR